MTLKTSSLHAQIPPVPQRNQMSPTDKIVVLGAAGLVGQNLMVELQHCGYRHLVAIDKHEYNLGIIQSLNSDAKIIAADLAEKGDWQSELRDAQCVIQLQAQITGKNRALFDRNNLESTAQVLEALNQCERPPYLIHISSSVVNSVANDDYTETKKTQEKMVINYGQQHSTNYVILRPTLMFGWFDPKHLGWLARFMEWTPLFPIPGDGRYMRQPLYNRDFCRIIVRCMESQPEGQIYDIVGREQIDYIDMIYAIKKAKRLNTPIIKIPVSLFSRLLKFYSLFSKQPPFTADQLKALTAGDEFIGVDTIAVFGLPLTAFSDAINETFNHPQYSQIRVQRT